MSRATALDHVGVAGRGLGELAAAYGRLGFTLAPLARHSGRRAPGGPIEAFGTGNRCAMLRQGYIELVGVVDPAAFNFVGDYMGRYDGIHVLALATDDAEAAASRLRASGMDVPGAVALERLVDDAYPDGPRARFARVRPPEAPEAETFLIQHFTPEALWQERFTTHANACVALDEVVMSVPDPAATARRLSLLAGRDAAPEDGGFVIALPRGRLRMLPPDAEPFPGAAVPAAPSVAGIALRTSDGNASLRRVLEANAIPHRILGTDVLVPPEAAGGACLLFRR